MKPIWKVVEKCPTPLIDTGCTYCNINLPSPIKQGNLNLTKALPWKHLLVLSHGYTHIDQLPKKINDVGINRQITTILLSNGWKSAAHPILYSFMFLDNHKDERKHPDNELVYIYPDGIKVEFHSQHLEQFCHKYLKPLHVQHSANPFETSTKVRVKEINVDSSNFLQSKITEQLFLVCGHTQRDARCGVIAPRVVDELRTVTGKNDKIGTVSHIGGHDYAGNVIIYPQNIWYGRVMPSNVQGIYNCLQSGEIIKELFRGDLKSLW